MSLQLSGLTGGLVATIVMTALMMGLGDDSPPPTAALWAKYVGDGPPDDYLPQGMTLHLLYGIGAGWVFALLAGSGLLLFTPLTLVNGLLNGAIYGLALMVVAVGWMRGVIGLDPDPGQVGMMTTFHVVYGLVLGGWLGAGVLA